MEPRLKPLPKAIFFIVYNKSSAFHPIGKLHKKLAEYNVGLS